jgi:hypothetical protein
MCTNYCPQVATQLQLTNISIYQLCIKLVIKKVYTMMHGQKNIKLSYRCILFSVTMELVKNHGSDISYIAPLSKNYMVQLLHTICNNTDNTWCPTHWRTRLAGGLLLRVTTIRRTTDTSLFISHTTNVLLFKFRCNIFIGVRIIKEMPGSVASGTPCISVKWVSVCKKNANVM